MHFVPFGDISTFCAFWRILCRASSTFGAVRAFVQLLALRLLVLSTYFVPFANLPLVLPVLVVQVQICSLLV